MGKNQLVKSICGIVLLTTISFAGFTQVTEAWVARYTSPDSHSDRGASVAVDGSGNIFVTGGSIGIGTNYDVATIKYNAAGVKLWVARYNGPINRFDYGSFVALDASGNVYVAGESEIATNSDYLTIKYNSAGVQQWVATYNGTGNGVDQVHSLVVDGSGNVYITGNSYGGGTFSDYATIKYNSSGALQWVRRYNGPGNGWDGALAVAVDASGNVFVTGQSLGTTTSGDFTTIKYNSAGTLQWISRYNGPANGFDAASSMSIDAAGNVLVTGGSTGTGTNYDYATIKYNPSTGAVNWVTRYNGPGNGEDNPSSLKLDGAGNVYVTGSSLGSSTNNDYATIKYSTTGVQQWVTRYNGPASGDDKPYAQAVDASGNVYVTGYTYGIGSSGDFTTIKYNSAGFQKWAIGYNGPANDFDGASSVALDASGNVYVTGASFGIGTNTDYATIKYSQPVARPAAFKATIDLPAIFRVSSYPNPVTNIGRIQYEIPFDGRVLVKVYDVLGREVATLVNANLKAGYYSTDFNASPFQKGMYSYTVTLTAERKILKESGKMVVVK